MNKTKKTALVSVLITVCIIFSGCLIEHRTYNRQAGFEPSLAEAKIEKIKPGITKKEWVLNTFGKPTSKSFLDDGTEVVEYQREYNKKQEFRILLVFETRSEKINTETLVIHIKDDVVQKYYMM